MTPDLQSDLKEVLDQYYCKKYDKMFTSFLDKQSHSWKGNHDEAPRLIADSNLLKIKILDRASGLKLTGDIELDHGYSYSYQVQIFFPSYFQVQILKS